MSRFAGLNKCFERLPLVNTLPGLDWFIVTWRLCALGANDIKRKIRGIPPPHWPLSLHSTASDQCISRRLQPCNFNSSYFDLTDALVAGFEMRYVQSEHASEVTAMLLMALVPAVIITCMATELLP